MLERKIISKDTIQCDDISTLEVFPKKNHDAVILINTYGGENCFVYLTDNLKKIDKKNKYLLNGFMADDKLKLAFKNFRDDRFIVISDSVLIYDVEDDSKDFIESDKNIAPLYIFDNPQINNSYFLLSSVKQYGFLRTLANIASGGHACGFVKPYLCKISDGRITNQKKIKYEGKSKETFLIKEAIGDSKMIHCLGLRQESHIQDGLPPHNTPIFLCYIGVDLSKMKTIQQQNIYQMKEDPFLQDIGIMSICNRDNKVYVTFSVHKFPYRGAPHNEIQKITSDIYFLQFNNNPENKPLQIAEGFMPLVKCDSEGRPCVFWINHNGNLLFKRKDKNKWTADKILINKIDMYPAITFRRYFAAEFDAQDVLHLVYPSNGSLIYEKIRITN